MEPDFRDSRVDGGLAQVMTVGDWIVTIVLMSIPVVNIIMLIVWATSATGNPNRKSYALASLLMIAIIFVFYLMIVIMFAGFFGGILSSLT